MRHEIVTYGHPVLRMKATPVGGVDADLKRLVDDMLETMYGERGLGLAAQQVGQTVSLCVIEVPPELDVVFEGGPRLNPHVPMPLVMFNPEIVSRSREQGVIDEGCLSFPQVHCDIPRHEGVVVRYLDYKGAPQSLELRGLVARAAQHELDHLKGVLFVDLVSAVRKLTLAATLKRLKRETAKRFEERQGKRELAT